MSLVEYLKSSNFSAVTEVETLHEEVTLCVDKSGWHDFANILKTDPKLSFDVLIDVCGVDYLHYGLTEWATNEVTFTGYSRARTELPDTIEEPRFASVYHFLSTEHNLRLRVKVMLESNDLSIASVNDIWPVANWFEREAYDLFGIVYEGHPDLRRILTDYGFIGHPLRKDFPLVGEVEIGYDAAKEACVYHPVDIQPRVVVPKVVRSDARYNEAGDSNE